MNPLRKNMRDHKRRIQRFNARINRMKKTFGFLEIVPLKTEDGLKTRGELYRFRDPFPKKITNYEIYYMNQNDFRNRVC